MTLITPRFIAGLVLVAVGMGILPGISVGATDPNLWCTMDHGFGRTVSGQHVYPWGGRTASPARDFADLPLDHPLARDIAQFRSWGIVQERCPGILGLEDTLTRGDLAKIVTTIAIHENLIPAVVFPLTPPYGDIPLHHHLAPELHTLRHYNIIDTNTSYRPNAPAQKIEAIVMLTRAYQLRTNPHVSLPFTDIQQSWYTPYLQAAYGNGYLAPMPRLEPSAPLTKERFYTLFSYFNYKHKRVVNRNNQQLIDTRNTRLYSPTVERVLPMPGAPARSTIAPVTPTPAPVGNTITLRGNNPSTSTLGASTTDTPLWTGSVSNGYNEAHMLTDIRFTVQGILPPSNTTRWTLHLGNQRVRGTLHQRSITFPGPFTLPAHSTMDMRVVVDTASTLQSMDGLLMLEAQGLLWLTTPGVSGSFPINGPRLATTNRHTPVVTISHYRSNPFDIPSHTQNTYLHTMRLSSSDPQGHILIQQLELRLRGTIPTNRVSNVRLYDHYTGHAIGQAAITLQGDRALLDLRSSAHGGLLLADGVDLLIDIHATIGNGAGTTLQFVIDRPGDISITDTLTNSRPQVSPVPYNTGVNLIYVR